MRGNDLYLDPVRLLPPPAFEGRLTAVRVEGDQLVQTFGAPAVATKLVLPDGGTPAYMYYKGGNLKFGKLLMLDADMQIVALNPTGYFGFDLDRYQQQLAVGYIRTLQDSGLEVFMANIESVSGKRAGRTAGRIAKVP